MSKPSEEFEQAYDNFLAGCDVDTTMLGCAEFMFNAGRESAGKQAEPVQPELSVGVDFEEGLATVVVMQKLNGGVLKIIHHEQIDVKHPAQPVQPAATPEEFNAQSFFSLWSSYCDKKMGIEDLKAINEQLLEALKLVLPLAKGYAAKNDVGGNQEYCVIAEAAIAEAEKAKGGGDEVTV